ncbi:MAG TPA: GtrA family protein [Patescibacteria group bacterium]|nr:GtrA family protein [Patescibacteria group bacterium]
MRITERFHMARADLIQFIEYMIGGTSYFWTGYGVFAACYSGFGWNWLPAKMLADAIGWTVNYFVQRYWAFNNPRLARHEGATVGKYAILTAVNFVLDYTIIWGLKRAGVSPYIGFFISAGFFTVWNFAWYRFWVFYAKSRGAKEATT